jgi:type II secretory pathway pseudopilin PulG
MTAGLLHAGDISEMRRGLTLLETLIYMGLFSILSMGVFVSISSIHDSSARIEALSSIQDEGVFITDKLRYVIESGTRITIPTLGQTSMTLKMQTGVHSTEYTLLNGVLIRRSLDDSRISSDMFSITNLKFARTADSRDNPTHIDISFLVTVHANSGTLLSREFSFTSYANK